MFKRKRLIIAILFLIILFIMTMYAGSPRQKETIATRTVKFIDSFNNSQISMQEVEIGKAASVPDAPKYTNYVFIGWYEGDSKITDFTNIIKDLTVYTKYADDINNNGIADNEDATYDVTFYDTLGRRNISTIKVLVGLNAAAPRVPTHIGYVFTGWSRSFTNIRESLTVNALFSPDTNRNNVADEKDARYTITFKTQGNGTITGQTEFANLLAGLNFGELVTIPKHEAGKGYTFMGWEPSLPEKDGKITSNVTYTAVFEDNTPPEVTSIKYSNDGKVTNEDIKVTITTNEEIKTPAGWTRVSTIEFTKPYAQNTTETFKIEDLAGNKSKDIKINVTGIDKNAPEIKDIEVSGHNYTDNGNYYGNKEVNIEVSATDNYSNTLYYKCGNDSWTTNNTCVVAEANGAYVIKIKDEVGNESETSLNIYINTIRPSVDFVTTGGVSYNGDYAKNLKPIYVNTNKADKLLLSKYKWSNQSEYQSFNINNAISSPTSDGTYTLTIMLKDWYGNTNTITSNEFTIDNKLPLVTNKSYGPNKSTTGNVTVTITFDEDVIVETSGWSKKDNNPKVWYKTYSSNGTENVVYKDYAGNYGKSENVEVENIVTYNISYSETDPYNGAAIITTIKFSHYVFPEYDLFDLLNVWYWRPNLTECKWEGLLPYCKEWIRYYGNNITENAKFYSLDDSEIRPQIKISNFDRTLKDANITKEVAANKKSVLVKITADEPISINASGWNVVEGTNNNTWAKTYTSNTLLLGFIPNPDYITYKDAAGNSKIAVILVTEIK